MIILRLYSLTLVLLLCTLKASSQDIIFKNTTRQPLYFLDTTFSVSQQRLNIVIGSLQKLPQNTIFFNGAFDISNSIIDSFYFKSAFLRHFIITKSRFEFPIMIDSTDFDTLFILGGEFQHRVVIRNTHIRDFKFIQNKTPGDVLFLNCSVELLSLDSSFFEGKVKFANCTFKNLSFGSARFKESLDLGGTSILGDLRFDSCIFSSNLYLGSISTNSETKISFSNTSLPDTLDLSNNKFSNELNLTQINTAQTRKCKVLLYKTDLSKIKLNYHYFKLVFPVGISNDEKMSQYEELLQNFKSRNYLESYRILDIEYQEFKMRQKSFGFLCWIPKWWSNYGYNPERVFIWTGLFLLLFTFLNAGYLKSLIAKVYKIDHIPAKMPKFGWTRLWYGFIFTCMIFLPIKWDKIEFKNKGGVIYLFIQFGFGLICLWYIGKFIL